MTAGAAGDIAGIVLAGGAARRFGADKLVVEIDGVPLLHRALAAVAEVADHLVIVAAAGTAPSVPAALRSRTRVIHDRRPFEGPLAALGSALEGIEDPVAIVVGGDMPSLVPAVLQRLVVALDAGVSAATLEVPGRRHPLPLALRVPAARAASRTILARGDRALRDLVSALAAVAVPAPAWLALDPGATTIIDIDRPSDLPRRG